jgi:DNA-binding NtrC family response regulator
MRLGANDFFAKPFGSIDKIKLDIKNCLERRMLIRENERLKQEIISGTAGQEMVYACKAMETIIEQAARAAQLNLPVLVLGESGTGKELIARYIHAHSPRANEPFFAMNCGALSETLLEPTLFGHEKGAFTGAIATVKGYFEAAWGGTIFLDEIGETSPSFQVKLLRVLQECEIMRVGGAKSIKVDFRLISATNTDLANLIRQGDFRKDLFYRINVIRIEVPPLRERSGDIPLLLDHFMHQVCERNAIKKKRFPPEVLACLMQYPWEGNVRELRNLVERIAVFSRRPMITLEDLPREYRNGCNDPREATDMPHNYEQAKALFESRYMKNLMADTGEDLKQASILSGLDLSTLYRKKNRLTE